MLVLVGRFFINFKGGNMGRDGARSVFTCADKLFLIN